MDIKQLLQISVDKRASDLHILPELRPLLRIDGALTPLKECNPLSPETTQEMLVNLLTPEQQKVFSTNRVLEMALHIPQVGNFRTSIYHQLKGTAGAFRIIPEKVPTFDELELPQSIKPLLSLSHGLILVTGPTGSGKSTTLAAMIDYINSFRSCNIFTIEDPIEYIHENNRSVFNQIEVGRDTPDFATALRASLRQDPNVIMLGELRDLETMRLALTAAETGHLVMATLHSCTAPLAINRFADVFPTEEKNRVRTLLAETLQAVLCQRLVKRLNGGRVAAFEVMHTIPAIQNYIRQDLPAHMASTMQTNGDLGMFTMDQNLEELVRKRIISSMTATSVATDQKSLMEMYKRGDHK